jgi:hypothetical protein
LGYILGDFFTNSPGRPEHRLKCMSAVLIQTSDVVAWHSVAHDQLFGFLILPVLEPILWISVLDENIPGYISWNLIWPKRFRTNFHPQTADKCYKLIFDHFKILAETVS